LINGADQGSTSQKVPPTRAVRDRKSSQTRDRKNPKKSWLKTKSPGQLYALQLPSKLSNPGRLGLLNAFRRAKSDHTRASLIRQFWRKSSSAVLRHRGTLPSSQKKTNQQKAATT